MNDQNQTYVADFFKWQNQADNASKHAKTAFIGIHRTAEARVELCTMLDELKLVKTEKGKAIYTKKRKQIQNASKRDYILKELYGKEWQEWTISIIQGKDGFEWIEKRKPKQKKVDESGKADESVSAGQNEPNVNIVRTLKLHNAEYIAKHGKTETIVDEMEETIKMLQEMVANLKSK